MNTKHILLLLSVAAFSSCTTLYKSGQTPDDVYFSPARSYGEGKTEDRVERRNNNQYYAPQNNIYYADDIAIRMGIYDPRWRYLDNDYYYNPYHYAYNSGYYYNPYYWPYPVYGPIISKPVNPKVTTPRITNLSGYGAVKGYNNQSSASSRLVPGRAYNNNNGTAVGNALRKVLGSDNPNVNNNNNNTYRNNNNNNNNSNNNTRSYAPSSNSSSSSSSSGSSGGGVSRPPRGGNR